MSTSERRSDVGSKIMVGLLLGGFGTIVGFFVNVVWSEAHEANRSANSALIRVTTLEAHYNSIQGDLMEIKQILQRRIPPTN